MKIGGKDRFLAADDSVSLVDRARLLQKLSPLADNPEDLQRLLQTLDRFCRDHSIRHLKAFGSILGDVDTLDARPAFRRDSDLDLLVEFEPNTPVTLLDMARMERELTELFDRKVDLRTAGDLSPYFRQEVLSQAVEIHVRPA